MRLVSIAIDPDHDTPEVLRGYRVRFDAGPEWELVTGTREDIERVLRAFDAYGPNKMTHRPLSFLRPPGGDSWVRIDGLIGASDLMAEYRGLRRPVHVVSHLPDLDGASKESPIVARARSGSPCIYERDAGPRVARRDRSLGP